MLQVPCIHPSHSKGVAGAWYLLDATCLPDECAYIGMDSVYAIRVTLGGGGISYMHVVY